MVLKMDIQPKPSVITAFADWSTWAVMTAISLLGGFASFYQKMKNGHVRVWNLTELIGELTISAFVGIVFFNLCQHYGIDLNMTVAIVGISSHMGTKAIMLCERALSARFPTPPKD
jgi:hypothetical protein